MTVQYGEWFNERQWDCPEATHPHHDAALDQCPRCGCYRPANTDRLFDEAPWHEQRPGWLAELRRRRAGEPPKT